MELTQQELQRIKVIENAVFGRMTVAEASVVLNLSQRQVKRLKARWEAKTEKWVRHGNRGKRKPWAIPNAVRRRIVGLARGQYAGFNDSHLTEKLVEVKHIPISRESVRRILRGAKMASPQKRRAPRFRSRRERRPRRGAMLLGDASRDPWLEQRGPVLTLIGFQDDATGTVPGARFQLEHEDTLGYMRVLRATVEEHGIALSLYRDQHSTFQRNDRHWTLEEQLAGRQEPTQLGRVLEELGMEQIRALSAQAKGRIERLWRTFQDRLKSELRLAHACTLEEANAVLERFLPDYNRRFGVSPKEAASDFRPVGKKLNLDRVFSLRYQRKVGKDHVVVLGAKTLQLPPRPGRRSYAGEVVELSHQLNGELHVWRGQEHIHQVHMPLDYTPGQAPPRPAARRRKPRIYVYAGRPALGVCG